MIYKFNNKYIVFKKEVITELNSFRQIKKGQHEAGGILLGKVYGDSIIVDTITTPSVKDRSGRRFFYRDVQTAQEKVKEEWGKSGGERIYLGEWHTHPENKPTPSPDDKRLILNMLQKSKLEIDLLIMVIVGTSDFFIAIQEGALLTRLEQIENENSTEITILQNKANRIYGFTVVGYTGYAETGYDIYNAALSIICFGVINSIIQLTNNEELIIEQTQGYLKFLVPRLINESDEKSNILFSSMMININLLLKEIKSKEKTEIIILKNNES